MATLSMLLLLLSASVSVTMLVSAEADDEAALLAFKVAAINGGNHDPLPSWNSTNVCSWEGVICRGRHRRRVVALRLDSYELAGTLSHAIGNLTYLQTLNLSANWFHGDIPASIGRLAHLRTLDLSYNVFSEYGEGCDVSTLGDVYSLGILLLEMFTGRSPTDEMFKDSLGLHKFAEAALPSRAVEIADPAIWLHEEAMQEDADAAMVRCRSKQCLISVISLGVSCSKTKQSDRMPVRDAVVEMRAIRDGYLMTATH